MKKPQLYPFKFEPIFRHYIWGGTNLRRLGKVIGDDEIVAESWEVSDHDEDKSIVSNGHLKGKTLREIIAQFGEDVCPGTGNGRFPILIKYIDANRKLSVQVHPDDGYARRHEGPKELGKTECWYVMDAPPGAELVLGIKKGITRHDFERMIDENRIEDGISRIQVSKGDFIYLKSGTVHALLEGIMVCEIQENSDTTYRLYDWGRKGHDGKPRPLHIDRALDVINFLPAQSYESSMKELFIHYDKSAKNQIQELVRSPFFNIDLLHYTHNVTLTIDNAHFNTLNILDGEGDVVWDTSTLSFKRGETLLIPRTCRQYAIYSDNFTVLKTFL
jgi:mannose-6-phosphate isomerase